MPGQKLPILIIVLLLRAASGAAQGTAAPVVSPNPDYGQVSVPVPRAVALVADVARVIFSRDTGSDKVQALIDKRRARSERRDQNLIITVPKNKLTRSLGLVE